MTEQERQEQFWELTPDCKRVYLKIWFESEDDLTKNNIDLYWLGDVLGKTTQQIKGYISHLEQKGIVSCREGMTGGERLTMVDPIIPDDYHENGENDIREYYKRC